MNWILIIIIALLFSAFFSGMEIAFVSSNKVRVELDMKQQGMMSKILGLFYGNEEQFISTMLVGNNIALVIYGMGMAALLEPVIALVWNQEAFVVLMQTLLSTLLILFVGEFLPKTIFRVNANATMRFFSPFVWLLYVVLYPISKFTSVVSKCVMRLGGVKIAHQPYGALMSKIELDSFIQKSIEESDSGEPVEPEMKIFQNALDFSNIHLRDCMIPRTELVAVDIDEVTVEELLQTFISTGISKVVVYRENIDYILGYIHASEMFRRHEDWKKSIRPAVFAPESMLANKLMRRIRVFGTYGNRANQRGVRIGYSRIGRLSHDRRVYLVSLSDIAEARRDRGNRELPVYYFTTKSYENRTCTHENREIRDFFVLSLPI